MKRNVNRNRKNNEEYSVSSISSVVSVVSAVWLVQQVASEFIKKNRARDALRLPLNTLKLALRLWALERHISKTSACEALPGDSRPSGLIPCFHLKNHLWCHCCHRHHHHHQQQLLLLPLHHHMMFSFVVFCILLPIFTCSFWVSSPLSAHLSAATRSMGWAYCADRSFATPVQAVAQPISDEHNKYIEI